MQVQFRPGSIQQKTMKSMDETACKAIMPDSQLFSVDLGEGALCRIVT